MVIGVESSVAPNVTQPPRTQSKNTISFIELKDYEQSLSGWFCIRGRNINVFDAQGNRKYLNRKERTLFYNAACRLHDNNEKAFCLTLFYCGCRLSEGLNLLPSNIDRLEKQIVFKTLKQKGEARFRAVPVPQELFNLLPMENDEGKIWKFSKVTAWRIIKRCMSKAGLEGSKATPKGLRHGFAVACISANIPITVVQRWLGHASLKNTAIYLEIGGAEDRKFAKRLWR